MNPALLPLLSLGFHILICEEVQVTATLLSWRLRGCSLLVLHILVDLLVLLPEHDGLPVGPDGTYHPQSLSTLPSCLENLGISLS